MESGVATEQEDTSTELPKSTAEIAPGNQPLDAQQPKVSCLFVWPPDPTGYLQRNAEFDLEALREMRVTIHETTSPTLSSIEFATLNGAGKGVDHVIWVVEHSESTEHVFAPNNTFRFDTEINPAGIQSEIDKLRGKMSFSTLILVTEAAFPKAPSDVKVVSYIYELPTTVGTLSSLAVPHQELTARFISEEKEANKKKDSRTSNGSRHPSFITGGRDRRKKGGPQRKEHR